MNLPNSITVTRIFLVPLLVVVLLTNFGNFRLFGVSKETLGATIFAIASLTDWLDGYLARRRKQVTGLGQWMDPLADKMLITAAFISLVQMNAARAWLVAVILGREFAVTFLRTIVHASGQTLPASPLGKIKLVSQVVAVMALILGSGPLPQVLVLGKVALWVAAITALISAADYYRRFNAIMSVKPARPAQPASGEPRRDRFSA